MKLKTGTITISSYDYQNKKHHILKNSLANDQIVKLYISKKFEERIQDTSEDEFKFGASYIIEKDEEPIAYTRFSELTCIGSFKFELALLEEFRNKGYSKEILTQIENYMFETRDDVTQIDLDIDKYNLPSMKSAEKAGYQKTKYDDLNKIYRYTKKRVSN